MKIPLSMQKELSAWNDGKGIDLDSWIACSGSFSLAVGYASLFFPDFFVFEDYLFLGEDCDEKFLENLRSLEKQKDQNAPELIEKLINHFHLADLHYAGCEDITTDKIIFLGEKLKHVFEARLAYMFPDKACVVEFFRPEDEEDLKGYYLTFWQKKFKE